MFHPRGGRGTCSVQRGVGCTAVSSKGVVRGAHFMQGGGRRIPVKAVCRPPPRQDVQQQRIQRSLKAPPINDIALC